MVATYDSLTATWNSPEGNYSSFTVKLQLNGTNVETIHKLAESRKHFTGLKTAANYTVIVYIVDRNLEGPPVESSKFTCESLWTLLYFFSKVITLKSIMSVNMVLVLLI